MAKLLRFASTHSGSDAQDVSLGDYIARMKHGQTAIYYVTAESFNAAKNSPHLEIFRKKGIEVLLLSDRVDEWVVGSLTEFEGKKLVSVARGDLDLGILADEASRLNETFNHWITHRTPFVTVKAAMSLDGKIATRTGDSKWITTERSRTHAMRLRQASDAILVGIRTVLADDPSLTVRTVAGRHIRPGTVRQPRRIVLQGLDSRHTS